MPFNRCVVAAAFIMCVGLSMADAPAAASQTPDTAVAAAVRRALSGQKESSRLAVSAAGSEVTLTGKVPTLWHKMDAIKRTLKVDGVKTVVSEIELPRAESDLSLATRLGPVIDRYPHYTMFDYVDAVIRNGVVKLTGSVTPDGKKAEDLETEVSRVPGVREIQNEIETLPPNQDDDAIRSSLYTRIFDNVNFENLDAATVPPFRIVVNRGIVTLYGFVQGEIEYRTLESIARSTSGVRRVDNKLKTRTKSRR
jgi:osmotically-inducible protein OsmY